MCTTIMIVHEFVHAARASQFYCWSSLNLLFYSGQSVAGTGDSSPIWIHSPAEYEHLNVSDAWYLMVLNCYSDY